MPGEVDGRTLRRALELYLEALERHREEIDSLNVYPVPDGDTGTNLLLTHRAVVEALTAAERAREPGAGDLGGLRDVASRASLMAARGNSGVILSQVLRGFLEALPDRGPARAEHVAAGLERAGVEAYRSLARPAEGTVLTVLRDAGRAATEAAEEGGGTAEVLERALDAARSSLARTREVHPELRRAGVVDAGGKGMVLLLDALRAAVSDAVLSEPVGALGPVGSEPAEEAGPPPEHGWEVQYLLEAPDPSVPGLQRALAAMGDSVAVVGGGGLYQVHVHTDRPEEAVEAGRSAGAPRDVSTVDLRQQVVECIGVRARAVRRGPKATTGLVAVAEGAGLRDAFGSLGAVVVRGGPGNNPAVSDVLSAIDAVAAPSVLVLPNHRNVVPAAERAAAESGKDVRVVPTSSIPAGLAAATAFNPSAEADPNEEDMREATELTRSAEITRARREGATPEGPVRPGDWIAFVDGDPVGAGPSLREVAAAVGRELGADGCELMTLIVGEGVSEADRETVRSALAEVATGARIDTLDGGQPRYPFLVGAE